MLIHSCVHIFVLWNVEGEYVSERRERIDKLMINMRQSVTYASCSQCRHSCDFLNNVTFPIGIAERLDAGRYRRGWGRRGAFGFLV